MSAGSSTPGPRQLPSGWWEGVPENLRGAFDRKDLRRGYILYVDGNVMLTGFFRNAYQAVVEDSGSHLVHLAMTSAGASPAQPRRVECSCGDGRKREPCPHIPAMLFLLFSRGVYAESAWALLALCVCRSHAETDLVTVTHSRLGSRLDTVEGKPALVLAVDSQSGPRWPARSLLPVGWESARSGSLFCELAREEISVLERETFKSMSATPSRRAELGPVGELCRQGFSVLPEPRARLDWDDTRKLFRLSLEGHSGAVRAEAYLLCDQAFSFRNRFPETALGDGFAEESWSKGMEIRLMDDGRIRLRPYAAASPGQIRFPDPDQAILKFGSMTYLPGAGFRTLTVPPGALFKRFTGWKTYSVESGDIASFLDKYHGEFQPSGYDVDPRLLGGAPCADIAELRVEVKERRGKRVRVGLEYRLRARAQAGSLPGAGPSLPATDAEAGLNLTRLKTLVDDGQALLITPTGRVDRARVEWSWLAGLKPDAWEGSAGDETLWLDAAFLIRVAVLQAPGRVTLSGLSAPELQALPSLGREFIPVPDSLGGSLADSRADSLADSPAHPHGRTGAPDTSGAPSLSQSLRPYQIEGLRWLIHLVESGVSGILADDMGLGKTHQVMALAAWLHHREGPAVRILVVCPTSVLYHWQEKLDRFHPGLEAALYYGPGRKAETLEGKVTLTSFGIARNDMESLRARTYDLLILDEIQNAKNRDSETHRAFLDFPARSVIGLSGTPLENGPMDVKNLFDLLLPGYFPGEAQFRQEVIDPLEQGNGVEEARDRFLRLCRPFILRRSKSEVLDDLPDKVEEVLHGDMTPDQAALYRESVERRGGPLLRDLQDSKPAGLMHVFQLLNHLKQLCNHPMSLPGADRGDREYGSGKWDLFEFILDQALEAGAKVVVFSQYLAMLGLIESHLRRKAVGFASLTGSTRDRAGVLKRFRDDPSCRVFCCSLKAGGVGIDLTAASTVIHYDRWWNAARENQATDRVHRIGQHRNVQVFKLVTRETIEERIDAIIRRKADYMDALLPEDGEGALKLFSRDDLIELLRP